MKTYLTQQINDPSISGEHIIADNIFIAERHLPDGYEIIGTLVEEGEIDI